MLLSHTITMPGSQIPPSGLGCDSMLDGQTGGWMEAFTISPLPKHGDKYLDKNAL